MLSVFDIYELLPHTDCGKCLPSNCMNMAKALCEGKCKITDCTVISADIENYSELAKLIAEGE